MDVWYVAYGSNLLRDRFLTYLRGGPVPDSDRVQHGARDGADPVDDRPLRLDLPLMFGGDAKGWGGGGVCFVDPHRDAAADTLGRAWLLTGEQLADVWAQENGETVGPPVDLVELAQTGSLDLGRGWYRRLHYLGEVEGAPAATITCDVAPEPNASGLAYLGVVGRGLIETWGLSASEAAVYLATRTGNRGHVDAEDLEQQLLASATRKG